MHEIIPTNSENEKRQNRAALRAAAGFLVFLLLGSIISRGIYAALLPKVEVERPSVQNLTHEVVVSGVLSPRRELCIYAEEGLRIDQIFVREGESVSENAALLQYDLSDLDRQIAQKKLALERISLQQEALWQNEALSSQQAARLKKRAEEDVRKADARGRADLAKAQEKETQTEQALKEARAEKELLLPSLSENEILKLDEKISALEATLTEQKNATEMTARQSEDSLQNAQRALEDASLPSPADSSSNLLLIEKRTTSAELALLEAIQGENGILKSKQAGTITHILISEGQRASDGPAFRITDASQGYYFEASLNQKQRGYVSVGDPVSLSIGFGKKLVQTNILSLRQSEQSEDYRMIIFLDADAGNPGDSGQALITKQEEKSSLTIPLSAIYEEKGVNFVLIAKETKTILGYEYVAERKNVTVTGGNALYASLTDQSISKDDLVIIDSTKPVMQGDKLRLFAS